MISTATVCAHSKPRITSHSTMPMPPAPTMPTTDAEAHGAARREVDAVHPPQAFGHAQARVLEACSVSWKAGPFARFSTVGRVSSTISVVQAQSGAVSRWAWHGALPCRHPTDC